MVEMKILKSREDWLAHRTGIGGSDSAAIVGMNPYMSNLDLFSIKTGTVYQEDISDKPCVKYGVDAEPLLRELFKLDFPEYKVMYEENNMWNNDKIPFAHASLDGWLEDKNGRKGILEIKTTEIMNSSMSKKWDGGIPDNYYIQVLHYLMVTEFDFAILKAQLKYQMDGDVFLRTKHYHIDREEVLHDIEYLAEKEKEFWKCVETGAKPNLILPVI